MTLTEQWNKGKLPEGDYYIKRRNGYLPYDNIDSRGVWRNSIDEDVVEVLAPVPSYEEWNQLHKFLEEFNALEVAKENEQLKGYNEYLRNIIKECEPYIENVCIALNMEKLANGDFSHKSNEVLSKIRTAIGEKK